MIKYKIPQKIDVINNIIQPNDYPNIMGGFNNISIGQGQQFTDVSYSNGKDSKIVMTLNNTTVNITIIHNGQNKGFIISGTGEKTLFFNQFDSTPIESISIRPLTGIITNITGFSKP